MSEKTASTSKSWHTYYQDRLEYYDSQEAALAAVDSIVASYEGGIWSERDSYLSLSYEQGVAVDSELFNSRFSTSSLILGSTDCRFRIDIYTKNKEDWIRKYGSDLLQQSLRAGYDCNEGYLAERLARDYPEFIVREWGKYKKVDTPSEKCLRACDRYKYSYCSSEKEDYYITIDNYLGKYQLVKFIDPNLEITRAEFPIVIMDSSIAVIDDKKEWILEYGSDLLQQSLMAGYDCRDRYLKERVAYEYPGFEINLQNYAKVNSPDESYLYACLGYEGSYCSSNNQCYYITIDNFLGKYQLIKRIDAPMKIAEESSIVRSTTNIFGTEVRRYGTLIISSSVLFAVSVASIYVFAMSLLWFSVCILLS
jgi:hypothetical protein